MQKRAQAKQGVGVWHRGWKWVTHAAREGVKGLWNSSTDANNQPNPQFKRMKGEVLQYPYFQKNPQKSISYAIQHVKSRRKPLQTQPVTKADKLETQWRKQYAHFNAKPPLQLTCPICMQLLVGGVTTPCGHTFCWQCLDEALLINPVCPVCRGNSVIGASFFPGKQIAHLVKGFCQMQNIQEKVSLQKSQTCCALLKSTSATLIGSFHYRMKEYQKWLSKRLLSDHKLVPSDMVDIRDTENIWCSGIVKKVVFIHGSQSLLIHYIGWSSLYDQVIPKESQRLASYRFYTGRKGIPRYQIEGGGQLQAYVLHNPWERAQEESDSDYEDSSGLQGEQDFQEAYSEQDNPEDEQFPHSMLVNQLVSTRDFSNKH